MQAWTKRAAQSREELRSEVVSPCSWVGRALAMASSTAAGLSGSGVMVFVMVMMRWWVMRWWVIRVCVGSMPFDGGLTES